MKKALLTSFLTLFIFAASFAQTATDFTVNDCNGNSHNLFTELDAGKVVVFVWVMPCGSCTGPALTTYNVVQTYQSSNPNRVFYYMVDDYANTSCSSLNTWANSIGVPQSASSLRFSNAAINMMDYVSTGMPKIVVVGGTSHTVFYNANNSVNSSALQAAINSALSATGVNGPNAISASFHVYPNPLKGSGEIKVSMAKTSDVSLSLYNLEGKLIQNLFAGKMYAGENTLALNAADYSEGMYLVKLTAKGRDSYLNVVVTH
jgi:hypothetical protein